MRRVTLCAVLVGFVLAVPAVVPAQTQYPPDVLERYWECMERTDLDSIRELVWYHHNVQRVDGRIYGLPENELDDGSILTIQERLDFRAAKAAMGVQLATSGQVQYPHHLRHSLDAYYLRTGMRPDCSLILGDGEVPPAQPEDLSNGWPTDLNITSTDTRDRGEVNVAIDPANPNRMIVTSVPCTSSGPTSSYKAVSTDYGQTWVRGSVGLNSGTQWECDPVSYYQRSTGNVYHAKLACQYYNCNTTWALLRRSSDGGTTFTDCAARPGTQTDEDREWITVDNTVGSLCYGTIYATWHNLNSEKVARSTDNCATWSVPATMSSPYTSITPDINTAADGRAYVAWQSYSDYKFKVRGSTDCGLTWFSPSMTTVMAENGGPSSTIPAQCERGFSGQPSLDVDRAPSSAFYGRVYVVMFDFNQACHDHNTANWHCADWDAAWTDTCNYDVWLSYSDNNGTTWSPAVNLTAAEGNLVDHFLGFMRVDPADGSIYIGYHRTRLAPLSATDRQYSHFFATRSTDGGATFEPAFQVSTIEGEERSVGHSLDWERGDYQGIDVYQGVMWPIWVDRRGYTGAGSEEEIITRKLCSEPAHWSERAPTYTTPSVMASGDAMITTVTWVEPDLYWGDGGETPSARKYQLWVDGSMVQDNIPAGTTSTQYSPGDQLMHTYVVRAVNQCGVYKDYVGVSYVAGSIFADGFETASTGAWSLAIP